MAGYLQNQSGATWLYTYHAKTGLYGCIPTTPKRGYMTVYLPNQPNNKGLYDCVPTKPNKQRGGYMAVDLPNQTNKEGVGEGATRMCTDQTKPAKRGLHGCVPTKPNSTTYNETHYRCTLRKRSSRTHFVEEPFKCHQHKCERCHMHCYLKERITI